MKRNTGSTKAGFYITIMSSFIGMLLFSCSSSPNIPAIAETSHEITPINILSPTSPSPTISSKPLPAFTSTMPAPTMTVATSSLIEGWLSYRSAMYQYEFSYPPETNLEIKSVESFPEALPARVTFDEYLYQLQNKFGDLCVIATYGQSFLLIQVPNSGDYVLCGGFGIGDEPIVEKSTQVSIDQKTYIARGWELYKQEGTKKMPYSEFFFVDVENGIHIAYGAASTNPAQFADYLNVKGTLLRMLTSYRTFK